MRSLISGERYSCYYYSFYNVSCLERPEVRFDKQKHTNDGNYEILEDLIVLHSEVEHVIHAPCIHLGDTSALR